MRHEGHITDGARIRGAVAGRHPASRAQIGTVDTVIITDNGTFEMAADGVLLVTSLGRTTTTESLQITYDAIDRLRSERRVLAFWDARRHPAIEPAGWIALINGLADRFRAVAVLINEDTPVAWEPYRATLNTMVVPFETFTDEATARTWLEQFRPNE